MARLLRIVTVTRDGLHNAFTDLVKWQGQYWIGYRKGASHASMDGEAIVAVSPNKCRFREVAHIRVAGDVRDPKFVPMSEDKLAAIFPVWIGGHQKRDLQQYVAFTNNGWDFEKPVEVQLPRNHWLWRAVKHNGRYYGVCYNFDKVKTNFAREYISELMVSDDLVKWETISRIGDSSMSLGETGMHFTAEGELWTVTRRNREPHTALLAIAKAPYTQWENHELGVFIHAPVIAESKGALYVCGRRHAGMEGDQGHPHSSPHGTMIWQLERGRVKPVLRLPAAGDCSYAGMITAEDGRLLVSYYSQHAYLDGVVAPQFDHGIDPVANADNAVTLFPSDVYFAEVEV
jgi:hypothetical protein